MISMVSTGLKRNYIKIRF